MSGEPIFVDEFDMADMRDKLSFEYATIWMLALKIVDGWELANRGCFDLKRSWSEITWGSCRGGIRIKLPEVKKKDLFVFFDKFYLDQEAGWCWLMICILANGDCFGVIFRFFGVSFRERELGRSAWLSMNSSSQEPKSSPKISQEFSFRESYTRNSWNIEKHSPIHISHHKDIYLPKNSS